MVTDIEDGRMKVRAESDAMIVSGLIALLIRLYSGTQLEEINGFDAKALLDEMGMIGPDLQADLDRVEAAGIPVDIVFKQGPAVLGL